MAKFTKHSAGLTIQMTRTHHPFLHPTKGWRSFARPAKGKSNRRRKLIRMGGLLVGGSNASMAIHRRFNKCRHQPPGYVGTGPH